MTVMSSILAVISVLTGNGHPVSIFSEIHPSREKNFTSINDVTFAAMERGASLYGKAALAMDRGYDNKQDVPET